MTHYLEQRKFRVKNPEGKVYEVYSFETYDGYSCLSLNLRLIGNIDDNGKFQRIDVGAYDGDDAEETVSQYFLAESAYEALEANDYTVIQE